MILEALVRHYDRLADNPESGVARYGFAPQNISFCAVLNKEGKLISVDDIRASIDGKIRPISLLVPHPGGKRTSGIRPYFAWDKCAYVFGRDAKEEQGNAGKRKRLAEQFDAFKTLHASFADAIECMEYSAFCTFLDSWNPDSIENVLPEWEQFATANLVFKVQGQTQFIHEVESVRNAWLRFLETEDAGDQSMCLVTGKMSPIARTHMPIKRVYDPGGQSEKSIVSFNLSAFNSCGKEQSLNASVGVQAAFKYPTALNALLADSKHRVQLGDTTVVFWTEKPASPDTDAPGTPDPADALAEAFGVYKDDREPKTEGETQTRSALRDFLERYRQGKQAHAAESLEAASPPFYVLGLSPNAARISVRFWLRCTVAELAERLDERSKALAVVGLAEDSTPSTWQLIRSTARDNKEIKPNIAGEYTRAFLNNRPLPRTFAGALLTRVRIEGEVNAARAAGLKAYLLTNGIAPMDIYLNREHPSPAYHAGRILAVLGFAQEQALGDINAGVVKKNFAAAMSTPGLTLGRLQRAAAVGHISKLGNSMAEFVNDELSQANCCLKDGPPKNLGPDGQTLFALGFYQQTTYLRAVKGRITEKHPNRSNMGEWMRTKLEVRVANALNKAGILYVYEPSVILEGAGAYERFPDFVVRGGGVSANDIYIEVAGYPGEEYDQRHQAKLAAYRNMGITEEGGERGRLVVLDYRDKDYDDVSVYDAIRFLLTESPKATSEKE